MSSGKMQGSAFSLRSCQDLFILAKLSSTNRLAEQRHLLFHLVQALLTATHPTNNSDIARRHPRATDSITCTARQYMCSTR